MARAIVDVHADLFLEMLHFPPGTKVHSFDVMKGGAVGLDPLNQQTTIRVLLEHPDIPDGGAGNMLQLTPAWQYFNYGRVEFRDWGL